MSRTIKYNAGAQSSLVTASTQFIAARTRIQWPALYTWRLRKICMNLYPTGAICLVHFAQFRNLSFLADVQKTVTTCPVPTELKPTFRKTSTGNILKVTSHYERLNVDFRRVLSSAACNKYMPTVVDEYTRIPFYCEWYNANNSVVGSLCN